jgi:exonuclease III
MSERRVSLVALSFSMSYEQFLIWNARGLNSRARRTIVRDVIALERVIVVCLQETKVAVFSVNMLNELLGPDFDYSFLPSIRVSRGVLIGWCRTVGEAHTKPSVCTQSWCN